LETATTTTCVTLYKTTTTTKQLQFQAFPCDAKKPNSIDIAILLCP